ncbi:MAG: hypothetical protein RLZZ136_1428 [Pseudomonadota bacterium]|jgi:hypothetical protein
MFTICSIVSSGLFSRATSGYAHCGKSGLAIGGRSRYAPDRSQGIERHCANRYPMNKSTREALTPVPQRDLTARFQLLGGSTGKDITYGGSYRLDAATY